MIDFLSLPIVIYLNAGLTGIFTKLADIAHDDGFKTRPGINIFLGLLWGVFGSLVVLGNTDVAAFYLGILLSWVQRYKLDNYSHGVGGSLILASIFYVHPHSLLQIAIITVTFTLFTGFGLLTRHKMVTKNVFTNYNLYSFIFLGWLAFYYSNIWVVFLASLANVIGYHGVKQWWTRKGRRNHRLENV